MVSSPPQQSKPLEAELATLAALLLLHSKLGSPRSHDKLVESVTAYKRGSQKRCYTATEFRAETAELQFDRQVQSHDNLTIAADYNCLLERKALVV